MQKSILDIVSQYLNEYDYNRYKYEDVETALAKESAGIKDFAAYLSPAALNYLEPMAKKAKEHTKRHFGNAIGMYTPLYIANYCENECVYCGFNCKNKIHRAKLSYEEIETELAAISKTGLKEILILTGESKHKSSVEYIGESIKIAKKYFSTIGLEIYTVDIEEYRYLRECGADFVSVYQETYDTDRYKQVHLRGPKTNFEYRFNSQERALLGGMRGVCFGALLGLGDFRKDAFAAGLHADFIQKKYPHAEVSFSVPRLRPFVNNIHNSPRDVHEKQLLQVMLAYRLFMPFAGINISTRERSGFRDNVIGLIATKISSGVSTGVGGHQQEEKGDAQFEIADPRSVEEIHNMLMSKGLQPVYSDYIRV